MSPRNRFLGFKSQLHFLPYVCLDAQGQGPHLCVKTTLGERRRVRQVAQERMWENQLEDDVQVRIYSILNGMMTYRRKAFGSSQRYLGKKLAVLIYGSHLS